MGYSLQYCLNECGNAVPGNECDWEDGVCPACRERREDAAKGEAMSGWTKEDTGALRGFHGMRQDSIADAIADESFAARAAAHIEALEARVAELEGPCSFCLETPGHGASKPICDGCAQLATDQAKTSRDLVERIANLEAERTALRGFRKQAIQRLHALADTMPEHTYQELEDALEAPPRPSPADIIPRAVLVSALREVVDTEYMVMRCETDGTNFDSRREYLILRLTRLANEIEVGAFPPKPKEGT